MLGHREVVLGIDRDITERKRAEEDTRRRANEFAASCPRPRRNLATAQELAALLQTIVNHAAGLLHVATAAMHLYDASQDELELVVAHGLPSVLGTAPSWARASRARSAEPAKQSLWTTLET